MKNKKWKGAFLLAMALAWSLLCGFSLPASHAPQVIVREETALPSTPPPDSQQQEEEIFQAVEPEGEEQEQEDSSPSQADPQSSPQQESASGSFLFENSLLEGRPLTTGETLLVGCAIALGISAIGVVGGRK